MKRYSVKTGKLIISISPRYYRELETNGLAGDPSETIQKTGWSPNYSFGDALEEMIKYELDKIKIENYEENIFIMGSEGVIDLRFFRFEDDFNVFKFDYQLGHDFTKEEALRYF